MIDSAAIPQLEATVYSVEFEFKAADGGTVWVESSHPLRVIPEAVVAGCLVTAMAKGTPLAVDGDLSEKFACGVDKIQQIYDTWFDEVVRVPVHTDIRPDRLNETAAGVGCFFSGGVDSFHSFYKHLDEVTHLIYIHGFDYPVDDEGLVKRMSDAVGSIAREFGKELIEIKTNLREFTNPHAEWGKHIFSSMLGSMGLLQTEILHKIYVPSSYGYAELFPWSSHPLTDPHWSTDCMEFFHDGCESTRVEKVFALAENRSVIEQLRVCWNLSPTRFRTAVEATAQDYNCGKCAKCLRTMVNLRLAGVLEHANFDSPMDLRDVARMSTEAVSTLRFLETALQRVSAPGHNDPALKQALTDALNGRYYKGVWRLYRSKFNPVKPLVAMLKPWLNPGYE